MWEESCVGGILCGRNPMWEESCVGGIPCGRNPMWEESHVGGILCGRNLMGGIPCGRNPVSEESHGRNPVWEESCCEESQGRNPIGRNSMTTSIIPYPKLIYLMPSVVFNCSLEHLAMTDILNKIYRLKPLMFIFYKIFVNSQE